MKISIVILLLCWYESNESHRSQRKRGDTSIVLKKFIIWAVMKIPRIAIDPFYIEYKKT